MANFRNIMVIGAGQMGSGIVQVCATHGIQTTLTDMSETQLEKAQQGIRKSLIKLHEKDKILDSPEEILSRITFAKEAKDASQIDLAIEAIVEDEEIKGKVFEKLDRDLGPQCILASNTSSIPITRMAARTSRPDRFIGMHFMNPVPLMKLVEIIPGMATSDETTQKITDLAVALGKEVSTSQDYPGFVVNKILMPMINEAFHTLMTGTATPEDIDKGMKLGTNQPMGPLTLADFIGLDTCKAILDVLYEGFGAPHYKPSPLLEKYVQAGFLGRKVGRGVYDYRKG